MSGPSFRTAVELDEWLAANQGFTVPPSAYVDQTKAAQRDVIAEREQVLGHKARWAPHAGLPEWVRLGMYDALLGWSEGTAATCIHQPNFGRPEPVYAAAWKPGVVVCAKCRHLLAVTGVADTVCDGCGHECQGMPDDGIMPVSAFVGALSYSLGVCMSCEAELKRVEQEANERLGHRPDCPKRDVPLEGRACYYCSGDADE